MTKTFLELTFTPNVLDAQRRYLGRAQELGPQQERVALTVNEEEFIRTRDSFHIATVSETGWPYVQHRGGAPGFLNVVSSTELAFADYKGNRQLLSTGNLVANDRVCLFLMDYPQRLRLKILGRARVLDARDHPELTARLAPPGTVKLVERLFLIDVVAYDWNCPKHITPRYSAAEVEEAMAPLRARNAELEALLKARTPPSYFTEETARQRVQAAEDAWNTRDPERVALAYSEDTEWRNRDEFLRGRAEVVEFLKRKWAREHDYRLKKTLWAFTDNRIAVRFEYEYHDDSGQWHRAHGNENWEFDSHGYLSRRYASINDQPIQESERKFRWSRPAQPAR